MRFQVPEDHLILGSRKGEDSQANKENPTPLLHVKIPAISNDEIINLLNAKNEETSSVKQDSANNREKMPS